LLLFCCCRRTCMFIPQQLEASATVSGFDSSTWAAASLLHWDLHALCEGNDHTYAFLTPPATGAAAAANSQLHTWMHRLQEHLEQQPDVMDRRYAFASLLVYDECCDQYSVEQLRSMPLERLEYLLPFGLLSMEILETRSAAAVPQPAVLAQQLLQEVNNIGSCTPNASDASQASVQRAVRTERLKQALYDVAPAAAAALAAEHAAEPDARADASAAAATDHPEQAAASAAGGGGAASAAAAASDAAAAGQDQPDLPDSYSQLLQVLQDFDKQKLQEMREKQQQQQQQQQQQPGGVERYETMCNLLRVACSAAEGQVEQQQQQQQVNMLPVLYLQSDGKVREVVGANGLTAAA
jgi:pyruvate/2-oxoglutarate dehydrogenase complex dihydrolipoamide acyltransferase (E2) component